MQELALTIWQSDITLVLQFPRYFSPKLKIGNSADFQNSDEIRLLRHLYYTGRLSFFIYPQYQLEIEPFSHNTDKWNAQDAIGSDDESILQNDNIGLGYRAGLRVTLFSWPAKIKQLLFGYSYDYGLNGISRYTYGSHEICFTVKFGIQPESTGGWIGI